MGNRGCIHRGHRIVRRQTTRRWIICTLTYKDWHRTVMTEGLYTELFFLDEATALAAGHRPCMFCRRPSATAFLRATRYRKVDALDLALDAERRSSKDRALVDVLPEGAMVEWEGVAWVVKGGKISPWSWAGYGGPLTPPEEPVIVLTPPTSLQALRDGYPCQIHDSAR